MYSVSGQLVLSDKFTGLKKELELNLDDGMYFIVLNDKETSRVSTKKIIITR